MREAIAAAVLVSVSLAQAAASAAGTAKGEAYKPTEATLEVYKAKCQACHMADGNSPLPPLNFADGVWKSGSSVKEIAKVIEDGVAGTAMLPFKGQVPDDQIEPLARYVRSFDKKPLTGAKKASKPSGK